MIRKMKLIREFKQKAATVNVERVPPHIHQMALQAKLHEEASEIADNPWDLDEYADLLQVIYDLMTVHGIDHLEVERRRLAKAEKFGDFLGGRLAWTDDKNYARD